MRRASLVRGEHDSRYARLRTTMQQTMAAKKYPLEPLVALREQASRAKTEELARNLRELAQREAEAEHARRATAQMAKRQDDERAGFVGELQRGELRAADMMQASNYAFVEAQRLGALDAAAREAERVQQMAETCAVAARNTLAETRAAEEVVLRDRERFTREQAKAAQAREEEAAEEAWRKK